MAVSGPNATNLTPSRVLVKCRDKLLEKGKGKKIFRLERPIGNGDCAWHPGLFWEFGRGACKQRHRDQLSNPCVSSSGLKKTLVVGSKDLPPPPLLAFALPFAFQSTKVLKYMLFGAFP